MTATCLGCKQSTTEILLDFGPQPPSNRFERSGAEATSDEHPLVIGQCQSCGLIQVIEPMAASMAKSRFEWLTYNEPEGHLDDLVSRLCMLPGIGLQSRIIGLTYKDDTTLARFNRLGYANTYRYDVNRDLHLNDACAGLETIQAAIDVQMTSQLAAKHGLADLLLVRHVLEHAHNPSIFLAALRMLVRPGGYILFEMPECSKFIAARDYSFLWEEHITYFSSQTLNTLMFCNDMAVHETIIYPYPLEDSLISVTKNDSHRASRAPSDAGPSVASGRAFSSGYANQRHRLHALMAAWKSAGKRIAVFGAGHLAAKFVNLYGLGEFIECVIDDHPNKQGLLMPGSHLPIRESAILEKVDICLLSLSPESERKVLAKHQAFMDRGGRFLSIFALSPNSVYQASAE